MMSREPLALAACLLALSLSPAGAAPQPRAARSRPAHPAPAKAVPGPKAIRLRVLPAEIRLNGPTSQQHLLVMATLADGSERDVTARVTLAVTGRAAALQAGQVLPRKDGSSVVLAQLGKLAARASVTVTNAGQPVAYSFQNDVVPVLAHLGCSAGTCHGANSGKGGFKLSLRGYAPELDFLSITRQLSGRRISREAPSSSLFLRKPLLEVAHGGGHVLQKGSREYDTLLGWLREGAPGPDEKDPKLVSLDALPGDRIYRPGEKQRVLISARFSDGHTEDVTDRAVFRTNDVGVADITPEGTFQAGSPGSTAVQAKYMDRLAVLRVTVPFPQTVNAAAFPKPVNFIDEAVYTKLRELHLSPSGACSDEEFLRRAFVDVLGTLPTADEARKFLDSTDPQKRDHLIDEVLRRPEYGSIWALKLCDVSMVRKEHMQRKYTLLFNQWLTEQFQANRPWDEIATELVAASGSKEEHPETLFYASRQMTRPNAHGWVRHYELTGEVVAQVFLGQRIQCCKCHNHPTEKYTQDDYYRFASVFAQLNGDRTAGDDPVPVQFLANDSGEVRHPRTGAVMDPEPLDRAHLDLKPGEDRRVAFARWMTQGAGKEMFSRNIVNRIWARLFGAGIVDPVDDLRQTNPARNEALLQALSDELIRHHYDLKYLVGLIMRSRTYQTTSVATPANKIDTQFFSHYPARRLQGEELLDAIAQVTGVPDKFASYPLGTRAIELSDTELPSLSLDTFGRPARTTPCECDRSMAPSVSQALELFNGETLQGKLKNPEGRLAQLVKGGKTNDAIVEELFLWAFARKPSAKEQADVSKVLSAAPNRDEALQDVLWALINSKEFMFDH